MTREKEGTVADPGRKRESSRRPDAPQEPRIDEAPEPIDPRATAK
jgi:hypothetical protein